MLNEVFSESIEAIKKNKVRSLLTGFGIAWGIFILTLLLSVSSSFDQGLRKALGGLNSRDILFTGGTVTKINVGAVQGSKIQFTASMLNDLESKFSEKINSVSPIVNYMPSKPIKSGKSFFYSQIIGVNNDYFNIDKKEIIEGRIFNKLDKAQTRKVVMLGSKTVEKNFKNEASVIGKNILIDDIWFTVIGVYKSASNFDFLNISEVIIPYYTLNNVLKNVIEFDSFRILPNEHADPIKLEKNITAFLSKELKFKKSDKQALDIVNSFEDSLDFRKLFGGLTIFLWFVGLSLLTTGVIGISNIMYISVKERTKEIGIRKALGATPSSITKMFMTESLLITNVAGLIGFVISVIMLKGINALLMSGDSMFEDFTVNAFNTSSIFLLLVFCGCLAGMFPAKKAASIKPILAINHNF